MNITFNDKIQLKDIQDLRKVYNFMYGYMQGIFETRYTCKVNIEECGNYFIVTNMDNHYIVTTYRKNSHESVGGFTTYDTLQEAVSYILNLEV